MAVIVVYNASDEKKLIGLNSRDNSVHDSSFDDRFVYLGDTRERNMTFTLSNVTKWDAGWYRCGKNGVAIKIPDCDQRLVVLGKTVDDVPWCEELRWSHFSFA